MKRWIGWLQGIVTLQITGEGLEEVLNLCAREGVLLEKMIRSQADVLEIQVTAIHFRALCRLLQTGDWQVRVERKQGLPYFLLGFRRRYALLAGLALSLLLFAVGARTVLTIEVTGNETIPTTVILSQLRLCGVSIGTYAPSIPIRAVENKMMLAMDGLSFFSINLHGTRAEVIVREAASPPDLREEQVPSDVISVATGIVTHIEPWMGDAQVQKGEVVCEGDVLISGHMAMDTPTPTETDMGTMLVHAEGKVLARTWRRLTAQIPLTAQEKVYTGEKLTHCSLSVLGKRVKFYQNAGIPYDNYDTIVKLKSWTPWGSQSLPLLWQKETYKAYETRQVTLDPVRAETMLREKLIEALEEQMDQGTILQTDYEVSRQGDLLQVTLMAQCTEQIGRMVAMEGVEGERVGPQHPLKEDPVKTDETTTKEQAEE